MRQSILRLIAAVFAAVLLTPNNGQAAPIQTIDFEASLTSFNAGVFTMLGLGGPVNTITGSVSFDPGAATIFGPTVLNPGDPINELTQTLRPYSSFTINVGGAMLTGAPSMAGTFSDRIFVQDGTGSNFGHSFSVASGTDKTLSPGVIQDNLILGVFSTLSENPFDGTAVPSVLALNSMNASDSLAITLRDSFGATFNANYTNIVFSEGVSPVPLPAALPLFASALAGFGFFGWRRRKQMATV